MKKNVKNNSITVRHTCNIGDLVAILAGLKGYYELTGQKSILRQELNVDAIYHMNYEHPTKEGGKQVMCNQSMFDMIKPLIEKQSYIESFEIFNGQETILDLNKIRGEIGVNLPFGSIQSWTMLAFPDLAFDISKTWVDVPNVNFSNSVSDKVLINFTSRYRNQFIHYYFLKKYQDQLLFTGTKVEYEEFCKKWELNIPYLNISNFLELAQMMKKSKFLLGNQSFCWNLNRAMNLPSILEMYAPAPNCTPFVGNHNYGFYHQGALEYYFEYLINKL